MPEFIRSGPALGLLAVAAVAGSLACRGKGSAALLGALVAGLLGLVLLILEWLGLPFSMQVHAYGSLFHTMVAMLITYVLLATAFTAVAVYRMRTEGPAVMPLHLQLNAMLWRFTAGAGLFLFFTLYLSPYLL